jgi:membrane associated rhomboid family serine protease
MFIYQSLFVEDLNAFYDIYGFSGSNFLERPYVLITSIFLHADIVHLLSNIFVLFFFGIALEGEIGKKVLMIFFLGAFLGDIVSIPAYGFNAVSIGASAGIFALVGAGMLIKPFDLSFYPLILPIPLALLGMMYAVYNLYEFFAAVPGSNISYIGHVAGLSVGLFFGFRRQGLGHGLKIILLIFAAMILIPVVWIIIRAVL